MMKASRPKPKRAPAAKKAAAQKKKHKIFKPRRTRHKVAAKRASKRKPNAQAARKAAAIASLPGVVVRGRIGPRYAEILSRDALAFLAELHRRCDGKRRDLLAARSKRQKRFDAGELPDFPPETRHIRDNDSWRVAPIPADLTDRRVEITGPVDRKMIVNALNSGATHYMADFEDANSPTWANNIEGQINLKDRWQGQIDFTDPHTKKRYAIGPKPAVLIVRPRGWHLSEAHLTVDGAPISGALFDFGLFFFHVRIGPFLPTRARRWCFSSSRGSTFPMTLRSKGRSAGRPRIYRTSTPSGCACSLTGGTTGDAREPVGRGDRGGGAGRLRLAAFDAL